MSRPPYRCAVVSYGNVLVDEQGRGAGSEGGLRNWPQASQALGVDGVDGQQEQRHEQLRGHLDDEHGRNT